MKKKQTLSAATYARRFSKYVHDHFTSDRQAGKAFDKHPTIIGESRKGIRNDRGIADKANYDIEIRIFFVPRPDKDQLF